MIKCLTWDRYVNTDNKMPLIVSRLAFSLKIYLWSGRFMANIWTIPSKLRSDGSKDIWLTEFETFEITLKYPRCKWKSTSFLSHVCKKSFMQYSSWLESNSSLSSWNWVFSTVDNKQVAFTWIYSRTVGKHQTFEWEK